MTNEFYEWYKEHHVCVGCRKEQAAPGRIRCFDCLEKERARQAKIRANRSDEEHARILEKTREAQHRLIQERRENGLCVKCGKKVMQGKRLCLECSIRERRANRKAWKKRQAAKAYVKTDFSPGTCSLCNKPALPGKKLCEYHYSRVMIGCRAAQKASPFRKMCDLLWAERKANDRG